MHSHCFAKYTRYNYTCPSCSKSLGDMSVYFRMVDSLVAHDRITLPQAYRERKQVSLKMIFVLWAVELCLETGMIACTCQESHMIINR